MNLVGRRSSEPNIQHAIWPPNKPSVLCQWNLSATRWPNHSRLRSSTSSRTSEDIGNSYQQEYHYVPDPDNHFEAESQSHIPHESHNRSVAATAALSSWGSIPWDVPSSIPNRPSSSFNLLNPEITAAVRDHDRNASHHRKADSWQRLMAKLFPAYMWLKGKTQNWTATNSQDSFTSKFCKCPDSAPRFHRWIDLVDITGQQRMRSPDEPTTGFSMRLLAYHNHAWHYSNVRMTPFAETQQVFNEERSETLWNKGQSAGRDLRNCLAETILVYRRLLDMNLDLIQSVLQLNDLQKLAVGTCPACFGPTLNTGLHRLPSVANRLNISLDGNFQHRHQKAAGRNVLPLEAPFMFIDPADLDRVKEYIADQERILKIRKKPDKCADSHKAGNDNRNETTWKSCDDTGIMGACCRHDAVIHLCNIHGTGENRALPLAILERIIKTIEPNRPIGVLYDLGCSLDKFIDLLCVHHANLTLQRRIWPESRSRLSFGTSVFGIHAGTGASVQIPQQESIINLVSWLRKKFDQALVRRDTEVDVISRLVQVCNPNGDGRQGYTVEFFRSQWQDQVRVALDKDEDAVGQSNLAMFYENEEVLNEIRGEICVGPWPSSLMELNNILTTIKEREEAQHKLAAMLGKDYEQLRGMRTTEVGMLTLLWKAKSDLFATAVDVRAERQPLISTDSGNILGTRLKEKIMAAIQRRSKPVDRAIKLFNQRRREYLQKYDPSRLRLPENKDMTLSEFQSMDLDDPLWNDGHFYHTRAPWATDPLVRGGIRSVHLLDRVEEEIELITQELDRAITWAHSYHGLILSKISLIELAAEEPVDVNNVEFSSFLTGFSMKGRLRLLHSELKLHLNEHERLMVGWMPDVRFLWTKTRCQYTKSEHPWFNVIETVKKHLNGADMAFIDDALENLTFAENGTNVEEQEQAENNAQDFEIPANEQPSDEGVDGEGRDGNEDGNSVMNTNAGAA
ncbi:hypothetical protein PSTT_13253 [Puccinia striiformis]|uniref:CxC1-like cysteine cluster associated with KDZ transposases domain-containing protein n=1 Tax=Puccinia striiformis TaxID=27350 RepID=A0A2S4UT21_9BASI|nr:hypothetical protein PSTT_13253 [Puccinia striiformis]